MPTKHGKEMPLIGDARTRSAALEKLRDRLFAEIDASGDARAVAALAKELRGVLSEIDSILPAEMPCLADSIALRRAEQLSRERRHG
jgi:hypothetical protein